MDPYQERVVAEKADLDAKLGKLMVFTTSDVFKALPYDERTRLIAQKDAMTAYSLILEQRIAAFSQSTDSAVVTNNAVNPYNSNLYTQRTEAA